MCELERKKVHRNGGKQPRWCPQTTKKLYCTQWNGKAIGDVEKFTTIIWVEELAKRFWTWTDIIELNNTKKTCSWIIQSWNLHAKKKKQIPNTTKNEMGKKKPANVKYKLWIMYRHLRVNSIHLLDMLIKANANKKGHRQNWAQQNTNNPLFLSKITKGTFDLRFIDPFCKFVHSHYVIVINVVVNFIFSTEAPTIYVNGELLFGYCTT